ncbi:MAG: hypothetical protein ACK4OM_07330 [Alphaproteobacteria bacterium]
MQNSPRKSQEQLDPNSTILQQEELERKMIEQMKLDRENINRTKKEIYTKGLLQTLDNYRKNIQPKIFKREQVKRKQAEINKIYKDSRNELSTVFPRIVEGIEGGVWFYIEDLIKVDYPYDYKTIMEALKIAKEAVSNKDWNFTPILSKLNSKAVESIKSIINFPNNLNYDPQNSKNEEIAARGALTNYLEYYTSIYNLKLIQLQYLTDLSQEEKQVEIEGYIDEEYRQDESISSNIKSKAREKYNSDDELKRIYIDRKEERWKEKKRDIWNKAFENYQLHFKEIKKEQENLNEETLVEGQKYVDKLYSSDKNNSKGSFL